MVATDILDSLADLLITIGNILYQKAKSAQSNGNKKAAEQAAAFILD
jgi:hypothetical protein